MTKTIKHGKLGIRHEEEEMNKIPATYAEMSFLIDMCRATISASWYGEASIIIQKSQLAELAEYSTNVGVTVGPTQSVVNDYIKVTLTCEDAPLKHKENTLEVWKKANDDMDVLIKKAKEVNRRAENLSLQACGLLEQANAMLAESEKLLEETDL